MDLRVFYTKIREATELIPGEFAVLVSRETPDGGKPGVMSEASKAIAARMLVEGRARLATPGEVETFRSLESDMRLKAEREAAPARLQVAVLSDKDIEALQAGRPSKSKDSK